MFLTRDPNEMCLLLYPESSWHDLPANIGKDEEEALEMSNLYQFLLDNSSRCRIDETSTILIPEKLRNYAQLKQGIMLVGVIDNFEIWDEGLWAGKKG